jgi:hypothetical protein
MGARGFVGPTFGSPTVEFPGEKVQFRSENAFGVAAAAQTADASDSGRQLPAAAHHGAAIPITRPTTAP